MKAYAVGNLKGGVGKTTVTLNLAVALIRQLRATNPDARVLITDMDTQAFATAILTDGDPRALKATIATMLAEITTPEDTLLHVDELPGLTDEAREAWDGIDLLPSNPDAKVIVSGVEDYWVLRETMTDWTPANVEWVLFDCGYGDNDSFNMAMAASDGVIGVTSASEGGMLGLRELRLKLSKLVKSFPHVTLAGVVANNFDLRRGPDKAILADLTEQLGPLLWKPMIPARAIVERAHGARLPLAALPDTAARELTAMYDQLARNLIAVTEAPAS